jgi:nucleoid-associated protein YgaU
VEQEMTGETKIGLITGLSVIIVFAMILSHKSGSRDEITPPLRMPDVHSEYVAEQPVPVPPAPPLPAPAAPASERPDESRAAAEASPQETQETSVPASPASSSTTPFDPDKFVSVESSEDSDEPRPAMTEALRDMIQGTPSAGEKRRPPSKPEPTPPPIKPLRRQNPDEPERVYVAQANDNLTRIAARFLGSASVRNVNLIYELNRDTMPDKDSLRAGQKIRLPRRAAPASPETQPSVKHEPVERTGTRTYRVQPGDSYAAIARDQLGSAKRWRELFELNKDRFPNPDLIQAGATIRLPSPAREGIRLASR